MKSPDIENLLSRLAFRAAMKKAFDWDFPVPEDALRALLEYPEFDRIYEQIKLSAPDSLSDAFLENRHFSALAEDIRIQQFIREYLAKQKAAEKNEKEQPTYPDKLWSLFKREFELGLRNRLRRLLNPSDHRESAPGSSDSVRVTAVPVAVSPASRHPVLKGTVLVLVSYAAYFVYHNPPDLKIAMVAPEKFPKVEMDSREVRFDKVHFDDVRFEKPPELQVAKLRFGDPPTLPLGRVHFDTPAPFSVNPLTLVEGSHIGLDTKGVTIGFDLRQHPEFAPLEVKAPSPFTLKLDSGGQTLQVNVNHSFDALFGSHPQATFTDKRQGFFRPTHTYTWDIKSANPPAPQNSQQGTPASAPASKTTQDQQSSKPGSQAATPTNPNSKSAIAGGETDQR